ncbi:MAG: transporter substrate-binding protein [Actinomycetota bacterium]|jgi:branched-chain amino acid transport system substrate-binding protein|nr:transporter substrate-binding protein [Actinomycetota bacterium]
MKLSRAAAVFAALAVVATLTVAGCGGNDEDQWKDETISLGSIFSTTGDGVPFGPQQVQGAQLAVEEINGDGGVNGAELTLTQNDDASDPATSAKEMASLISQEQVIAVLGPTFSNSAAEADPVANQKKTPVLAVSNTGPGIVGDCDYPCEFIFRNSLGEATAIPANIDNLVARENPQTAGLIHPPDDPFGETSAETARMAFEAAGVKVLENAASPDGAVRLVAGGKAGTTPDVFMITASSGETGASTITELREAGYKGPILGGNAFNSPLVARSAGQDGKGVQSASAWYSGNTSEENQDFIAGYQGKYGEAPDQFAAQAYTGVKLLAEAAEDADLKFEDVATDRESLKASLEEVDEETPLGQFSFTPDHDVIQPIWIVAMDGQGGYTLVEKVDP